MRSALPLAALLLAGAGCAREPEPDAYGNVEATEVLVAAEASGRILSFAPQEGQKLAAGAVVGVIEANQVALERDQAAAQRAAFASRVAEADQQIDVLEAQRKVALRSFERTQRLFAQKAATAQQLDQAERDHRVLLEQIQAARAQRESARREVASQDARVAQVGERIQKAQVTNPVAGTVLATYARAGEFAQAGQPLYKIADLEAVEVRAYVGETQLALVRIGQPAQVTVDAGQARRAFPGTVSWVSAEAEFTPTPIQTREERADLVYAIKVVVPNEGGILKIGMPADVRFAAAGAR